MSGSYFDYHLSSLKEKYPVFTPYENYHVFTFLCIKYFFFSEAGIPFDQDIVLDYLTDGANDGGIDAIFNDPTSENNDIIVVQSKFYENTILSTDVVAGELYKINETLKKLKAMDDNQSKNAPIVALTANAISGMREKYLSEGFDDYLAKPMDKKELEKVLQKFLSN